ncbi:hypothetical protein Tco_0733718 [Tanacetum coccineum]
MFIPNNSTVPKLQTVEDLQGDALLHYDAEMELMNLILLSIPNDIYNSVDACTSAKDMWKRVEHLMRGTIQNKQFEKLVNVSRAKKLEKSHDPLALVAHTGSSSRNTSSYYVTHPTFVVDYEDEYQQDDVHTNSEDPLKFAMLVNIQSMNSGNARRNNRRAYVQEEIVEGSNAPNENGNECYDSKILSMEQMLLAKQDEAGVILTDEQNDFLFADASRIYDSAFISEVQSSSNTENEEQMYPTHTKIINSTIGDDQIDSDIIFDSPNRNVNSGSIEKDTHVPDLCTSEIALNIRDTKDTLDDTSKSQQKVYEKMTDPIAVANKQNYNSIHDEIEQLKKKSIEIQEGLQARIKILEKDVQRCEKQSVDFELKLQHEKEKHKWDSSFKNKNTNPLDYSWNSKMEKLEDEDVSFDFTVQSLIKERDNVKIEYQKLFNSIKKTRSQSQTEMNELIAHVSEKTYAYGAIHAENQNLLFTISELKTRLAKVEKGKSVNTKFDKTNGSQPLLCVTPLNKHVIQKKTDVQKSKENHVVSKPVTLQTSPAKQSRVNSNKNVIAPGMYKVATTHESQTNKAKHNLSSTGMNVASSVRRPMNRDSHVKNSVLANSKKPTKKVAVYVRKNKQTDITSKNVISNKENVIDVDVANASKAKTLLCVSCMQNVLIP